MKKEECPAWGKTCDSCHGRNHFKNSNVCPVKKRVHAVREGNIQYELGSDSDSCVSISSVTCTADVYSVANSDTPIYCNMIIEGAPVQMQVDCGATVNVLPKQYLKEKPYSKECVKLRMWNHETTPALGRCRVKTVNPATGEKFKMNFVIVDNPGLTPLLSCKAAEKMKLITVNYHNFETVSAVSSSMDTICDKYPSVFDGSLGSLPGGKIHLTLEQNAEPVVRPPRTLPESLNSVVRDELDRLESTGVVVKVDKPTDWVNQMSVARKRSGDVRICIDPRPLNVALKREHHKLPVLDDILPRLVNSKRFAVFDLQQGYLHCELDVESSLMTTFATPFGRYRWNRLPFGLKVSSEIFQKRLQQALEGLDSVHCVADDVIVHGVDDITLSANVDKLLQRCQQYGMKLNI